MAELLTLLIKMITKESHSHKNHEIVDDDDEAKGSIVENIFNISPVLTNRIEAVSGQVTPDSISTFESTEEAQINSLMV